jgi:putative ABC transport system permease protein
MFWVAFKMLIGDRAKYLLLVSALSFAALLMTHQGSIFLGLLRWSTATIRNTHVPLWVVDPLVEQPGEVLPLLDTDLTLVRSVQGVEWAVPVYFSIQQARLQSGNFRPIQLFGLDTATLVGAPSRMLEGSIEDIWQDGAIVIDQVGVEQFSAGRENKIQIGDQLEINDHEVRVVGICKSERSFFGYPYVYTTYDRAIELTPMRRKNLAFVLASPEKGISIEAVASRIENETGLKAYTEEKFFKSTIRWVFKNTGIPMSFSITIIMGFLVGVAVAGQTFYSFVLENLKHLGALTAMGASNSLLCRMLILQAFLVGLVGYGIGVGLTSLFGHLAIMKESIPFFMPYHVLLITFGAIMAICLFAALLGINKVRKYDAAEVFRG